MSSRARSLLAALAVSAALGISAPRPARAADAAPITFGAILPLTGPGAVIGTEQMKGIQFALKQQNAKGGIDGHPIRVVFEDDQAKPDQAVLAFNKLVGLQHLPMIYTAYSGPSLAMAPLTARKHVLMLNAGAQSDKLAHASPYLFNTLPTTADEVGVMVKYLRAHGKSTSVVLYENDAAGIGGRDDFVREFKAAGGKILAQEPTQFGQTDYRPALLKLAAAKAQVLFVVTTAGQKSMADQLHQMNQTWLVAGTTFMEDPPTIADPNAKGIIHTQVVANASPELMAAFKKEMGAEMGFFSRQYYNATQIMFALTEHLLKEHKAITGENLRAAIFQIKTFHGLVPMTFTTNTAVVPVAINEMTGGSEKTIATGTAH
ncbi:MAG: ABC transporter substrate-binding protein [Rhodospirillales bacterium]|jgi:branched-chain amino acid transport system substrate-binding protein|nr:ABC transporter substrate-binding protein [Rhodospirillales bacterium]